MNNFQSLHRRSFEEFIRNSRDYSSKLKTRVSSEFLAVQKTLVTQARSSGQLRSLLLISIRNNELDYLSLLISKDILVFSDFKCILRQVGGSCLGLLVAHAYSPNICFSLNGGVIDSGQLPTFFYSVVGSSSAFEVLENPSLLHIFKIPEFSKIAILACLSIAELAECKSKIDEVENFGHIDYFRVLDKDLDELALRAGSYINALSRGLPQFLKSFIGYHSQHIIDLHLRGLIQKESLEYLGVKYEGVPDSAEKLIACDRNLVYYKMPNLKVVCNGDVFGSMLTSKISTSIYHETFVNSRLYRSGAIINDQGIVSSSLNCDPFKTYDKYPLVDAAYALNRCLSLRSDVSASIAGVSLTAIHSRDPYSYVHFLMDVVPKILYARDKALDVDQTIFGAPLKEWQIEIFDQLGISKSGFLCMPEGLDYLNLEKSIHIASSDGYYPSVEALQILRSSVQSSLNTNGENIANLSISGEGQRLFIGRKAGFRSLINELELVEVASRYGFNYALMSNYSVLNQWRLLNSSKIVVGVGGAALANMIAMPSGSTLIHFGPLTNWGNYFEYIASVYGINYHAIGGQSIVTTHGRYPSFDYMINPRDLENVLSNS